MKKNSLPFIILCVAFIMVISASSCKRGATPDPTVTGPAGYRIILSGTANPSTLYVPQSEPSASTLIAVRALKNDGSPASGYTIVFEDQLGYGFFEGFKVSDTRVTDSNGRAQINYFIPPASNIRSTIAGQIKATLVDNGRLDNLPLSDVWDVIPLRVIPYMQQGYILHGNVLTPAGNGVENVAITLTGEGGNPSGVTVTRPSGSYEFFVGGGWYGTLVPTAPGYTFTPENYTFLAINPIQSDRYYLDFVANFAGGNVLGADITEWTVGMLGGSVLVNVVNATGDETISYSIVPSTPWIHVNPASGVTPGSFTIIVDENNLAEARTGTIVISASNTEVSTVTITINQLASDVPAGSILAADVTNIIATNAKSDYTINVFNAGPTPSAPINYAITPNATWITVSQPQGTTNDSFILTIAASTVGDRNSTVTLRPLSSGVSNTVTIYVNQGGGPSIAVTPSSYNAPSTAGHTFTVTITNPTSSDVMNWTLTSSVGWLGFSPTTGTTLGANVAITLQTANTSTSPRQAQITFKASNGATAILVVTQAGI